MDWQMIIAIIVLALILILAIVYLIRNQKARVLEWLKYAVSMAETELGKKTGQLKLRLVYDWFIEKFPHFSAFLPFKIFSSWVDVALETLNSWLKSGNAISDYILTSELTRDNASDEK